MVDEAKLAELVANRSKRPFVRADWATRRDEGDDDFEAAEINRLKKAEDDARQAFYYASLQLRIAKEFVKRPPSPVDGEPAPKRAK